MVRARRQTYTLAVSGYGGGWHSPGFISDSQYKAGDLTPATNPTDGGNEGFGTVRGSMERPAWDGTLTSTLYAHGGTWHIFLTIPPEGGIGEGVQSQTEELDQRFGMGGTTRWAKQFGATHLEVGLDYRVVEAQYQRYYTTDRVRDSVFLFDETPANLSALYAGIAPIVEAHWDVTRDLSLGLGGRLDWIDYSTKQRSGGPTTTDGQWVASPKLSAIYRFTGKLSAYVSYNGGYRSSDGAIVTPSLPPALERASELGVRYTGQRFEGSVALFLINVSNQQTVDPITLQPSSGGTTRQQGVELDGRVGVLRWLSLFAHATVNDAHYVHLVTEDGTDLSGTAGVPGGEVHRAVRARPAAGRVRWFDLGGVHRSMDAGESGGHAHLALHAAQRARRVPDRRRMERRGGRAEHPGPEVCRGAGERVHQSRARRANCFLTVRHGF